MSEKRVKETKWKGEKVGGSGVENVPANEYYPALSSDRLLLGMYVCATKGHATR